jgi:hypothetical protein
VRNATLPRNEAKLSACTSIAAWAALSVSLSEVQDDKENDAE